MVQRLVASAAHAGRSCTTVQDPGPARQAVRRKPALLQLRGIQHTSNRRPKFPSPPQTFIRRVSSLASSGGRSSPAVRRPLTTSLANGEPVERLSRFAFRAKQRGPTVLSGRQFSSPVHALPQHPTPHPQSEHEPQLVQDPLQTSGQSTARAGLPRNIYDAPAWPPPVDSAFKSGFSIFWKSNN